MPFLQGVDIYANRKELQLRVRNDVAERFLIDKVAPAANRLAKDQTGYGKVDERKKRELLGFGEDQRGEKPADHAAVDGEAALIDREDFQQIVRVILPFERNVIQARADNGKRNCEQDEVQDDVRMITAILCAQRSEQ